MLMQSQCASWIENFALWFGFFLMSSWDFLTSSMGQLLCLLVYKLCIARCHYALQHQWCWKEFAFPMSCNLCGVTETALPSQLEHCHCSSFSWEGDMRRVKTRQLKQLLCSNNHKNLIAAMVTCCFPHFWSHKWRNLYGISNMYTSLLDSPLMKKCISLEPGNYRIPCGIRLVFLRGG